MTGCRTFCFRRLALCAVFFASSGAAFGQSRVPPPPVFPAPPLPPAAATSNNLEQRIAAVLDTPELRGASVGVFVRSLAAGGRVLFARNADLLLVPASNQKILTAATALTRLGPDHVFVTRLGGVGVRDKNVWRGDLVLVGAGDPSLSSVRLREMVRALKTSGVRRVTGRIVADDGRFDEKRLGAGWQWDDEPFDYQPQVSALNLDENVVSVRVTPGRAPGDPALVTLDPPTAYVRIASTVRTVAAKEAANVAFDRARGRNDLIVSGTIAVGAKPATAALTVEEPSLFAATRLGELLKEEGVVVAGGPPVRAAAPPVAGVTPLAESASEPLSVLVRDMMKRSDNLYAETLLKAAGAAIGSGVGTTAGGARTVAALVATAGGGNPAVVLRVADGSGLSRLDLVTPQVLATLLAYLADPAKAGTGVARAFGDALPVGGVDGTLRNRFKNTSAQGVVRAKTGSLTGVSTLSGYLTTKAGEPLVFSILMNNVLAGTAAARRAQDAFVLVLIDAPIR
jgi:D-alanyl-D-alanine carboxypeptidase/D-alanyl-D-alanine-endopeptidase (penicillin-binding protein 4)